MDTVHTIGRRKTSVARIFVSEGKGAITVNKKKLHRLLPNTNFTIQNPTTLYIDQYGGELRFKCNGQRRRN